MALPSSGNTESRKPTLTSLKRKRSTSPEPRGAWSTASNTLFAPRWQSREETNGAEQRTNGGDEPCLAARRRERARRAAEADAAEPGAALGLHVGLGLGRHVALADAEYARRLRSRLRQASSSRNACAPSPLVQQVL